MCPVRFSKQIPSGFVLAFTLHHLLQVSSLIPHYFSVLPYSYITNENRLHTCLAVTQVPYVFSHDSKWCTWTLFCLADRELKQLIFGENRPLILVTLVVEVH